METGEWVASEDAPMENQRRTVARGGRASARLATRVFATMAAAGAKAYSRARDLPKLIALWPRELDDESAEGCRLVLGKLRRALRAERRRASSGHWSYDLNRHLALVTAYKAEASRLGAEEARLRPTAPAAAET